MSEQYNGWTNYETWCVASWLDNQEYSYNAWRERADELYGETEEDADKEDRIEAVARVLSAELRTVFEVNNPLADQASCYADLLNAAISEVDWFAIAEHYITETME